VRHPYFATVLACLAGFAASAQAPALPATEPAVLVVTYRLTYQPDSTDKTTRSEPMVLLLGKNLSKFESQRQQQADSMMVTAKDVPFTQEMVQALTSKMMAMPRSGFHYAIYKTAATKHVYYYDRIGLSSFRYEEPADAFAWTIAPATATIAGYACQRATATFAGRTWEAWFTREMPISEGPYKFYGLPGLIVKVGDTRQQYVFELLKLGKTATEQLVAFPTKAATSSTKAAFQKALADFNLDPVGRLSNTANGGGYIILQNPEEARQRARERAKKQNNPLELK